MSIQFQRTIDLPQSPSQVFAVLEDVSQTPKWLSRCNGIEVLSPGPLAPGSKLRYSYREGGRVGTMDGQVIDRTPDQNLLFSYDDKMMHVDVHFALAPNNSGTRLTHTIDVTPKTFMAKLFSPLIRRGLPKQTINAMESLRTLLANSSQAPAGV
jgi:carbon monoxide dehydrogenase subunit G